MQFDIYRRWAFLRWSMLVGLIILASPLRGVMAQTPCCYGDNAGTRPGIEEAVGRFYTTDGNPNQLSAYVFRFDSEANAVASLEAIDARELRGVLDEEAAIEIDELGPETVAYTWEYDASGFNEAVILSVDGPYLYIVSVVPWDADIDAATLATATIQDMIAAGQGEDPGVFQPDGTSSGGLWDKLPPGDGESPAGFTVAWDEQLYPAPEVSGDDSDSDGVDYASLEGVRRVVTRTYSGDTSAIASPQTAPDGTYFLLTLVGEFDSEENAAKALEALHAESRTGLGEDFPAAMESVDPGDIGDRAVAERGILEEGGVRYEVTIVIVQDGNYMYAASTIGLGEEANTLEAATAVAEAMVDAEAGSGDGEYDESGIFLTGGLWDKFPAEGDAVLRGMTPEEDKQVYP